MIAKERLWLTATEDRVVADGHPDAAFLLAGEGCEFSDDDARRFGIINGRIPDGPEPEPIEVEPEPVKEAEPDGDKQVVADEDKASGLTITRSKKRGG